MFGAPEGLNYRTPIPESLSDMACGYGKINRTLYGFYEVAGIALSNPLFKSRPQKGCGTCVALRCAEPQGCMFGKDKDGNLRELTITVVDNCGSGCKENQFNLHALAFLKLASWQQGRVEVEYREVPCPRKGNIVVHVTNYRQDGNRGGWIRLTLQNVKGDGGITSVEMAASRSDTWQKMSNTYGAVWELNTFPSPPLDIRATNQKGEVVVLRSALTMAGTTGSFYSDGQFND